jgi:hypothetical protein
MAKPGSVTIARGMTTSIFHDDAGDYLDFKGISFNYNTDMRMKGRVALEMNSEIIYFSISAHDDLTGQTGKVLIGRFNDLSTGNYEAWEYWDTGLHVGLYQLELSTDSLFLFGSGNFDGFGSLIAFDPSTDLSTVRC